MSVGENDCLRANLLELCRELRDNVVPLKQCASLNELTMMRQAGEAVASAAVCLMSGRYDCPTHIAINVETLERCLTALNKNLRKLDTELSVTHA